MVCENKSLSFNIRWYTRQTRANDLSDKMRAEVRVSFLTQHSVFYREIDRSRDRNNVCGSENEEKSKEQALDKI